MLNVIIAQVTEVYQKNKEGAEALIVKERASLIVETEDIMEALGWQNEYKFPKFIILREKEEQSNENN